MLALICFRYVFLEGTIIIIFYPSAITDDVLNDFLYRIIFVSTQFFRKSNKYYIGVGDNCYTPLSKIGSNKSKNTMNKCLSGLAKWIYLYYFLPFSTIKKGKQKFLVTFLHKKKPLFH